GAEVDGLALDLLDAAARADRFIVEPDAALGLIGLGPLGVDRVGEGGASARDIRGVGGGPQAGKQRAGDERAGRDDKRCSHGGPPRLSRRWPRERATRPSPRSVTVFLRRRDSSSILNGWICAIFWGLPAFFKKPPNFPRAPAVTDGSGRA